MPTGFQNLSGGTGIDRAANRTCRRASVGRSYRLMGSPSFIRGPTLCWALLATLGAGLYSNNGPSWGDSPKLDLE